MFTTIVSTSQLAEHLGEWVVVDCRSDLKNEPAGRQAYRQGHIPGAVYASLATDLSAPPTGSNGRHPLPSIQEMVDTFSATGIEPGKQVVAYDTDNGMFASRLWWMLRYLGHDPVAVLDGGFNKWIAEKRATRGGDEHRTPATFVPHVRADWLVTLDDMANGVATSALLIDARAPERFEGRVEPSDRVAGRIPGALNRFHKDNVTVEGVMRPAAELRRDFEGLLQSRPARDVVMYCGSGVTACENLLAMEHAGLDGARLYAGSWSEWSADPARPIETGAARK